MEQKENLQKNTSTLNLSVFAQSAKYIRFKRYFGIDIREQSQRNYRALVTRLDERAHLPEAEHQRYGTGRLSPEEVSFFRFWHRQIMPLFTARHGTEQFAYIQHTGCLMSVADRRRANGVYLNSRTGGFSRQDYSYFVLGIGAKHPVPVSVANSKTITLHFNRMTADEKRQYAGMFIGGHDSDYSRDITYPIVVCGDTQYKVNYNKTTRLRTTTFKRADGTIITEILSFADEIIAADPSIDVIFEWLGYKMIEYLRFIGGDFQQDILACNNIDRIATVFHALFPSYRFPELKISLTKIPVSAKYVEVSNSSEASYKEVNDFHRACHQLDLRAVEATINSTLANAPNGEGKTPLSLALTNYSRGPNTQIILQLLLKNYADPNSDTLIDSNFSRALEVGDPALLRLLMHGATSPHCPTLRLLPKISYIEMKAIIQSHQFSLFEEFYPQYLEYSSSQILLDLACRNTVETVKQSKNSELTQRSQKDYEDSYHILERVLADTDPNSDDEEEKAFCQAAQDGKLRVVRAFLKHPKLNINQLTTSNRHTTSDHEGWTALHYACWKGHLDIVVELIKAGINVNAKSYAGQTALAVAENVLSGSLDFMSLQERQSEQLTNNNLSMLFKSDLGKRKMSTEDEDKWRAIITALKEKGATRDLEAENQEKSHQTNFAVVACITATFKNSRHVVLVRKKNQFDEACGMHLFPGGFYDNQRDQGNFTASAIREVREETGIDLAGVTSTTLAVYENKIQTVHFKRHFFHFDLGTVDRLPFCIANSDIAEALWVNFEQIECTLHNDELAMNFRDIPLNHSNVLILDALKAEKLLNPQIIIESEQVTLEKKPANIAAALFLAFHLQSAYSVRDQLMDVFLEMRPQIPEGYLLRNFDELLLALKKSDSEDIAKACVQNFITHLVRTGHCNINDLRQKGFPLLHLTCMSRITTVITWLLDQGANVNSIFSELFNVYTPLSSAILVNDLVSARLLIERYGANINFGTTTDSALTIACSLPAIPDDFIEYLIEKSGVITDEQLGTLVHELIRNRRLALLDKVLTQFPIDLNRQYIRRQDLQSKIHPILTAINTYSLECVKLLEKHGADLTLQYSAHSNLIGFAKFMGRDLGSKQLQIIARLPSHPKHQKEPGYYSMMKSPFAEEELSEEELKQQLTVVEKNLAELDQIIELLQSLKPKKDPEPQSLDEYVMRSLSNLK